MELSTNTTRCEKLRNSTETLSGYVDFWKATAQDGIYCQWYQAEITFKKNSIHPTLLKDLNTILDVVGYEVDLDLIESKEFSDCEQLMMMGKVLLFEPSKVDVMMSHYGEPWSSQKEGKKVQNFDQHVWDSVNIVWVAICNYLKFTQHADLKKAIKDTGDDILIEASPKDRIWGVGLKPGDKRLAHPDQWRGQNRLGVALMAVRDLL